MILFKHESVKDLTQAIYNTIVDLINITAIPCECGHVGFHKHGIYERNVKNSDECVTLKIRRVQCPCCGVTHALLPYCLIPWSQVPLETTVCIVQAKSAGAIRQILSTVLSLHEEDIRNIRKRFKKHWKQRMLSEGITCNSELTDTCIEKFGRQFMQIHCGRLKKFVIPTKGDISLTSASL